MLNAKPDVLARLKASTPTNLEMAFARDLAVATEKQSVRDFVLQLADAASEEVVDQALASPEVQGEHSRPLNLFGDLVKEVLRLPEQRRAALRAKLARAE